ncbi:hypothetical protein J1614_006448 [Plenodomus biglobosus]|nr:hypothetical protein J1614_006448 [Plenodomus biglobosus]
MMSLFFAVYRLLLRKDRLCQVTDIRIIYGASAITRALQLPQLQKSRCNGEVWHWSFRGGCVAHWECKAGNVPVVQWVWPAVDIATTLVVAKTCTLLYY